MPPFRHPMRVRYSECDPQGVVFNANYLMYFDHAIGELWREAFGSYQAMVDAGTDMVVAEATVRFRVPLRFDEDFEVTIEVTRLGTTSITSALAAERDGAVATEGELRHVFIDPETGEKRAIPDDVRAALAGYASPAATR
jgi:acyl-CoA thioester hydrolase